MANFVEPGSTVIDISVRQSSTEASKVNIWVDGVRRTTCTRNEAPRWVRMYLVAALGLL